MLLRQLADDAVTLVASPQPEAAPLTEAAHGHLGAVALRHELPPRRPKIGGPEVPGAQLPVPLPPLGKLRHGALPALRPEFGAEAVRVVALVDAAGVLVEEGVALPRREGHGPRLLLHRLVGVQEPPPVAAHEEHGGAPPHAEGPDLLRAHPLGATIHLYVMGGQQQLLTAEMLEMASHPSEAGS